MAPEVEKAQNQEVVAPVAPAKSPLDAQSSAGLDVRVNQAQLAKEAFNQIQPTQLSDYMIRECPHSTVKKTLSNIREFYRTSSSSTDPSAADKKFMDEVGSYFLADKKGGGKELAWKDKRNGESVWTLAQGREVVERLLQDGKIDASVIDDNLSYDLTRIVHPRWKQEQQRSFDGIKDKARKFEEAEASHRAALVATHLITGDHFHNGTGGKLYAKKEIVDTPVSTYGDATKPSAEKLRWQAKNGPESLQNEVTRIAAASGVSISAPNQSQISKTASASNASPALKKEASKLYQMCKDDSSAAVVALVEMKIKNSAQYEQLRELAKSKYRDSGTKPEVKEGLASMGRAFNIADQSFLEAQELLKQQNNTKGLSSACKNLAQQDGVNLQGVSKALELAVRFKSDRKPVEVAFNQAREMAELERRIVNSKDQPDHLKKSVDDFVSKRPGVEHIASFLYRQEAMVENSRVSDVLKNFTPKVLDELGELIAQKIYDIEPSERTEKTERQLAVLKALKDKIEASGSYVRLQSTPEAELKEADKQGGTDETYQASKFPPKTTLAA
jgi:hypothetical protein